MGERIRNEPARQAGKWAPCKGCEHGRHHRSGLHLEEREMIPGPRLPHVLSHSLHYGSGVFEASAATRIPRRRRATSSVCATIWSACIAAARSLIDLPYSVDELCGTRRAIRRTTCRRATSVRSCTALRRDGRRSHQRFTDVAIAVCTWDTYLGDGALDNGVAVGVSSWRQRTNNSFRLRLCRKAPLPT